MTLNFKLLPFVFLNVYHISNFPFGQDDIGQHHVLSPSQCRHGPGERVRLGVIIWLHKVLPLLEGHVFSLLLTPLPSFNR